MEYDYDAQRSKIQELHGHLLDLIPVKGSKQKDIANEIIKTCLSLTPPEKKEAVLHIITLDSSGSGGRSCKPGNIILDWKNVAELSFEAPLVTSSMVKSPPWAYFCIVLLLLLRLIRMAEKELGEVEASVMYALWTNRSPDEKVSEDDGYKKTNAVRKVADQALLSRDEFETAINKLLKLRCIDLEEGIIRIHERVHISYN